MLKRFFWQKGAQKALFAILLYSSFLNAAPINLTQDERLWFASHPIVRVGFYANKPPYSFVNPNGTFSGAISSYFDHFETLLNIQFKPIPANSWEELFMLMHEGKIDIICGIPSHLEKPEYIKTTQTIFSVPLSILVLKNSPIYENFEGFLEKRIATTEKSVLNPIIEKKYPKMRLFEADSFEKALDALNLDHHDGIIAEARLIEYHLSLNKMWGSYSNYILPISYEIQIGSHRDLPHLYSAMQKIINNLTNEQKNDFISKWTAVRIQPIVKKWHLIILVGILAIILLFLMMKYRLLSFQLNKLHIQNRLTATHLETLTDALNGGSWVWHIAENKSIINSRYATMLGYEKDEIPPTFDGVMGLIAPEDTALMLSALKRHIDKVEPFFSVYIKLRHKDGSYRLVHTFGGVLAYSEDGSPKTLGGCNMIVREETPTNTSEFPVDNITGILTHHHYRAFVPLYFKQARQEYSGVMLILFRLVFQDDDEALRQEALNRFSIALFERLPAPSGLCFYMGEGVFSSFFWNDDPNEAQIIAQDLHTNLETIIISFSSTVYLHSGTAFMLPGSNVDEANLYQNAYVNLAQKDPLET